MFGRETGAKEFTGPRSSTVPHRMNEEHSNKSRIQIIMHTCFGYSQCLTLHGVSTAPKHTAFRDGATRNRTACVCLALALLYIVSSIAPFGNWMLWRCRCYRCGHCACVRIAVFCGARDWFRQMGWLWFGCVAFGRLGFFFFFGAPR